MGDDITIEDKVRDAGQAIYSGMRTVPPVFDKRRWSGKILEWSMKNEEFKLALFRFIDVLPSLKNNGQFVRLLHEYFDEKVEMPMVLESGLRMIKDRGVISGIAGQMIRKGIESFAHEFIAGNDPRDAEANFDRVLADGARLSVDLLGEVVVSDKEAKTYAERYAGLIDFLTRRVSVHARSDVSVKISAFDAHLDPVDWDRSVARVKDALRPLLLKAKEQRISITFDMEHYYYKSLTLAIFKSILEEKEFGERPYIGIALQTYLKDSERDITELIAWARSRGRKITIRLVKGAYWDYEVVINRQRGWPLPVFLNKQETDNNFEKMTNMLFENYDIIRPAIATHNLRSASYAIACAESRKTPNGEFEFQVLYGMADPLRKALRRQGFTVRVYTPIGELVPGMAYLIRRLLENTSNESFLRRSFSKAASFEELIRPPHNGKITPIGPVSANRFRNEPLLDFSLEANRKKMTDAVRSMKEGLNGIYPLIINGRKISTAREIVSVNPARPAEVVGRVSSADKKDAEAGIEAAIISRDRWRTTSPGERAEYLFKAAEAMRKKRVELAALEVFEVGKTWKDADGDVTEAIDYLEYYGRESLRLVAPHILDSYPGEKNEYAYTPRGIGVVIAPWNFPLAIATGMVSASLVTGNCVIFKPSGLSPVTGYRLVEIFQSIGLPPGVLQFLPGPGSDVGEYLVSHPAIDFVAFTGSKDVGLRIVQHAAETRKGQRNVKKVIAEMGGKNAVIVDETADLDEAVKGIVESAFGYQGQRCSACSRVIIVGEIYHELCARLAEAASSLLIGPPEKPGTSIGPVIDETALKKIRSYIETGKKEGKVLLETKVPGEGYFIGPVIFTDAEPESRIATEEIFGPVLTILRAKNIDHAIQIANESIYALTGGVYSRSPAVIRKVKEEFLVGNLYINRKITGALVGRQPFGGFGMSGVGSKAGGPDYLFQFMNPVSISENTIRRGFAPFRKE